MYVRDVLYSTAGWSGFVLLASLYLFPMAMIDRLRTRDREQRRALFRARMRRVALVPLYLIHGTRLTMDNPLQERFEKQAIVICNHTSVFDLLILISIVPKMSVLMKAAFRKNWIFANVAKFAGYHFVDDTEALYQQVEEDIRMGYSILIFPEGTRTTDGQLGPFRKGAFTIARYFGVDILPVVLHGMYTLLPKRHFVAHPSDITLEVHARVRPESKFAQQSVLKQMRQMEAFYRECLTDKQSVCIIGGGMGGLFTGALLATAGRKVTVVEKNGIIGGGLQSFKRGDTWFNTGMHNFGGWSEEWALSHLLQFVGAKEGLKVKAVDEDAQEIVWTDTKHSYRLPRGREAMEAYLGGLFPKEKEGLHKYLDALYAIANSFDHYYMRRPEPHPEVTAYAEMHVEELMRMFIADEELIRVLSYMAPLCGHAIKDVPVSVHSMLSVLYMDGEYRFEDNALQMAEALQQSIERHGGYVLTHAEVEKVEVSEAHVHGIVLKDGRRIEAEQYVAAIAPKELFSLTTEDVVRKVSRKRAESFTPDSSALSIYLKLKPETFPFVNSTILLPNLEKDDILPPYILLTTPPVSEQGEWAHTMEILVPTHIARFEAWSDKPMHHRGEDYEALKRRMAEEVIAHIDAYYPVKDAIEYMEIATPLTIRDYYHNSGGAIFSQQGLYMPLRTRTDNLYLTGQSVLYHGMCGVPLTAILTAEAVTGEDLLTGIRETKTNK